MGILSGEWAGLIWFGFVALLFILLWSSIEKVGQHHLGGG